MTAVQFRNPEVRLSASLDATRAAVQGDEVTLRALLGYIGEQGLLVFCAILAMPFLLPVTLPFMSTVLGLPMLLIGAAIALNRLPWLPERLLDRPLSAATLRQVLERASRAAARFEHLVRPRLLALTSGPLVNVLHGLVLIITVVLLMAPLPLVPFANTLPAVAIILLCLGMAERDGALILSGYLVAALSTVYIGALIWLAALAGGNLDTAFERLQALLAKT